MLKIVINEESLISVLVNDCGGTDAIVIFACGPETFMYAERFWADTAIVKPNISKLELSSLFTNICFSLPEIMGIACAT